MLTISTNAYQQGEQKAMKKLLVIALGLGIALGAVSFAQETANDGGKKMAPKGKKGKKKTGDKTTSQK